jgi:hypothetical protein
LANAELGLREAESLFQVSSGSQSALLCLRLVMLQRKSELLPLLLQHFPLGPQAISQRLRDDFF